MTTPPRRSIPLSIWLCTAAMIAFVATALFDLDGLWRWSVVALGLALAIAGGVRLGVELVRRHAPEGPGRRQSRGEQ